MSSSLRNWVSPLILTAILTGCGQNNQSAPAAAPPMMPPSEVSILRVSTGTQAVTQDLQGRVTAYRTAEVRARVEGILEKRLFKEGSLVKAGQSLFAIDPRVLQADLASARAALARAQANVGLAKQTVTRYRQLIQEQGVSKQELDQAEANLKQAEAEVGVNQAALARTQLNLNYASVFAPISGRIGRAFVTEGALVGKNEATHLATIEQIDPIYVNFTQASSDLLKLKKQMQAGTVQAASTIPVELLLSDGTIYPLKGQFNFAEQTVDPNTGTITLRAEFRNPEGLLLPGMFATVRFALGEMTQTIRVPQRAVIQAPQGASVLVVGADNKVSARPVKTGAFTGQDWIITEGLKNGEAVIVEGLQKAKPGAVVKPVPLGAGPNAKPMGAK